MQLKIDALKEAAAWPGAGPAHPRRARHQLMAAEPYQEGHPPARRADFATGTSPVCAPLAVASPIAKFTRCPDAARPGNAYIREDQILPRLPALRILLGARPAAAESRAQHTHRSRSGEQR